MHNLRCYNYKDEVYSSALHEWQGVRENEPRSGRVICVFHMLRNRPVVKCRVPMCLRVSRKPVLAQR